MIIYILNCCFFLIFKLQKQKSSASAGFTLTEFILGMALSAIVFTLFGRFLINFHQNREAYRVMLEIQEQAQYALDFIINGYNRAEDEGDLEASVNFRYRGLMWASKYDFDPNRIHLELSADGHQLVQSDQPADPNDQDTGKRIFFPDYTPFIKGAGGERYVGYIQRSRKLYQVILDPNGVHNNKQIIPYLDGSNEYRGGPYRVEVNFCRGTGHTLPPGGIEPDAIDPNQVVSIYVSISKDGLSYSLNSTVKLRNYQSDG